MHLKLPFGGSKISLTPAEFAQIIEVDQKRQVENHIFTVYTKRIHLKLKMKHI